MQHVNRERVFGRELGHSLDLRVDLLPPLGKRHTVGSENNPIQHEILCDRDPHPRQHLADRIQRFPISLLSEELRTRLELIKSDLRLTCDVHHIVNVQHLQRLRSCVTELLERCPFWNRLFPILSSRHASSHAVKEQGMNRQSFQSLSDVRLGMSVDELSRLGDELSDHIFVGESLRLLLPVVHLGDLCANVDHILDDALVGIGPVAGVWQNCQLLVRSGSFLQLLGHDSVPDSRSCRRKLPLVAACGRLSMVVLTKMPVDVEAFYTCTGKRQNITGLISGPSAANQIEHTRQPCVESIDILKVFHDKRARCGY